MSLCSYPSRMHDICQCESSGCQAKGGIRLDTRTIQKHRCKDQLRIFKKAKTDSERALEEQLDRVSHHLSKFTLTADSPAQTTSTTDDLCHQLTSLSLNSKSNEALSMKDAKADNEHDPPSRSSTIQDVLAHMNNIKAATTALQRNTASAFKNSVDVSHFTLDPLLLDCYSLQASLSKVTLKAAPVTAMKEGVSKILSKVQVQLEAQKFELAKKQKLVAAPVYLTGKAFIEFIYNI